MRKKTVIAMLVMCMALSAAACGEKKTSEETKSGTEASADESKETAENTDNKKEDSKKSQVRLVSVTDLSKYIKVGEYKDLSLERVLVPVVDEEVEAEIDYRLQEKAEEVQDAAAEEGDQVRISFSGTIDGQSFDGSTEEDYDIVVGESGIADGFDDGIIGMKKGETKEITVTFPEDYYDSELVGKTAVYQVTVQKISRVPELTDEWVAANTESKTADEYKAAVKKELEANAEEMALYQLYGDAWYTVLENSEILEYPKEDVEKASEAYKEMYKQYLDQAQMDMSEFLRSQGLSEEEYEEECKAYAEEKVKQNLIVQYIIDEEGLSLDDEEAKKLQEDMLKQYGAADLAELTEIYGQTEVDESLALLRVEKFIVDQAQISEKVGEGDDLAENEDAYTEDTYDTQDGMETDTGEDAEIPEEEGESNVPEEDDLVVEE